MGMRKTAANRNRTVVLAQKVSNPKISELHDKGWPKQRIFAKQKKAKHLQVEDLCRAKLYHVLSRWVLFTFVLERGFRSRHLQNVDHEAQEFSMFYGSFITRCIQVADLHTKSPAQT